MSNKQDKIMPEQNWDQLLEQNDECNPDYRRRFMDEVDDEEDDDWDYQAEDEAEDEVLGDDWED